MPNRDGLAVAGWNSHMPEWIMAGFWGLLVAGEQAKHRKRSGQQQRSEKDAPGSGTAIAIGALLDGIPESIVIGLSLLAGEGVSLVAVAAVFISNIPEGLSSSAGMKNAGRSAAFVFAVWGGIAVASGLAAIVGYVAFEGLSPDIVAATTAVAAGAILAMLVDTMIPEAFETAHEYAGLITVVGFLVAFALTKMNGLTADGRLTTVPVSREEELSGAGWCRQQYAASHSCVTGRVGIRANARVRSRDVQGVATARR